MFTGVQSSGGNYTCYTCTSVDNSNCKSPSEFNPSGITTQDGCNYCSVSIIQTIKYPLFIYLKHKYN